MAAAARFTVVGGGLAGLMTTIKLAEAGHQVDVLSLVPVKRSHSVCAQGGINGAVNTKGEGDHPDIHVKDTLRGGDFLAEQVSVKGMCYAAPGIIYLLDRMGVTFNRTPEGLLDFRRFGGTLHNRTAFAGATTGQQLLYALDEQVRRYEAEGKVTKYEYWEWLGTVKDESGRCIGSVAMDLRTMEIRTFPAEAVCLATGGPGIVFGRSTNSIINTGTAAGRAYMEGALYANGEFIQVHPTSIPGEDKLRLMSESVRGEGGRVWVPRKKGDTRNPRDIAESERWYFLEEKYPKYKNLVPRDVATREIFMVCRDLGLGLGGRDGVYLDVTHIPAKTLDAKIKGVMEIYEKFVGDDPRHTPMVIFPGMHYSMGGLHVSFEADSRTQTPLDGSPVNQSTRIPGLYAAGEADSAFHGANRLGANSLLSCIYSGMIGGPAMVSFAKNQETSAAAMPEKYFADAKKYWQDRFATIKAMNGQENPYQIAKELGEVMTENCTVVRYNDRLKKTIERVRELKQRWNNVNVLDTGVVANRALSYTNQVWNMLELGEVIATSALLRDESRGAHYKPDFSLPEPKVKDPTKDPEWMDLWRKRHEKWAKTTIATYAAQGPQISYQDLPTPVLDPEPRWYA
ncbi:succinate dehydrogenase flavoprotein subunit [Corallococcus sp. AB004]|uniref:succinate dehydrogenase flavoprotein subunit n=1 Tax=Corallococcus TaxID=83461 RepID=UPI000EA14745|nr:succinate dehydrogenase flavoprotein subunit [Corallococcus exiguus]NPC71848.1 succinate dehydrogenase flavoprotein subunit [Corallococcus exiguus]NPD25217.1 succinate dehydrogenase flavoprotein subunit [Corallococcus exiguus]RKI02085.1 succinate dehydrogenase flavoprotein subunit [Corallococcus sp. AB038B]RKI41579.1 succinate dehydrogenase flavoprotein subunit [Corallococcus sp. AB004]